jgi:hypothetical protein
MANAIPENSPKEKKPKDQQTEMQNGRREIHTKQKIASGFKNESQ